MNQQPTFVVTGQYQWNSYVDIPEELLTHRSSPTGRTVATVRSAAAGMIRGVNRKARVLWGVGGVGTDYSITDEKDPEAWTCYLDPARLVWPSRTAFQAALRKSEFAGDTLNPEALPNIAGAAMHELAHTLFSPNTNMLSKLDPEILDVMRPYEDLYVNHLVEEFYYPNFDPYLRCAMRWTNSLGSVNDHVANQPPTNFLGWVMRVAAADMLAYRLFRADCPPGRHHADLSEGVRGSVPIEVPDEPTRLMCEAVRPIADRLTVGKKLSWKERERVYTEIRDAIRQHIPADWQPQPQSQPQYEVGCKGGQPMDNGDKAASASGQHLPQSIRQALEDSNKRAAQDDAEKQSASGKSKDKDEQGPGSGKDIPEGVDYAIATQEHHPHIDQRRANRLRSIFRARSSGRRTIYHGETQGRLSTRRLVPIKLGSDAIFKHRPIIRTDAAVVLLLIDGSGSMSGAPWESAATAARELYEAIAHNPDYRVYAWSYSGRNGRVQARAAHFRNGKLIWPGMLSGSTPSYAACAAAGEFLNKRHPRARRVVIHFTDCDATDSKSAAFGETFREPRLSLHSVSVVGQTQVREWAAKHPEMNIAHHTVADLPAAVQEIVARLQ